MATPDRTGDETVPDEHSLYARLPLAKLIAATIALTLVISLVMVPIHWNGVQG